MVEVFKFNKEMEGNTYYLKPIPVMYNGKFTYTPPFSFVTAYTNPGILNVPLHRYISYCIINGELKINIYGNAVHKIMDLGTVTHKLMPINVPKVAKVNVRVQQGFLDLSNSGIVHLDDCDIDYKDKFIIKDTSEYKELIKDISEEQLYQVVSEECHLVISYSTDERIIKEIKNLLSVMTIRMRTMKLKKLKKMI